MEQNIKKTVLLCVTGLTPQVVTETLYALYKSGQTLPDSIHILSTSEGVDRARLTLINDHWFERFYKDYKLPQPVFNAAHIHVLQDQNGQALQDIRSQQDNQAMADAITEKIRQFTADPACRLHVSIAGGRKTMGFYAGYALSLYGREQDQLSHVLVSANYESHPQFYYPTPYPNTIYSHDKSNKPLDTQQAEVVLADIAFVRLRHGLDRQLLEGQSSFTESVQRAQQALGPAKLVLKRQQWILIAQDISLRLKPAEWVFYHWILQNQLNDKKLISCPNEGAADKDYATRYLHYYCQLLGEMGNTERTQKTLKHGMSKSFFEQRKSRINRQLKDALGNHAEPYLIAAKGKRPNTHYIIQLEQAQIHYQES